MKKILIGLASLTLFSSSSLVTAACTTSNHNTEIIKLKINKLI